MKLPLLKKKSSEKKAIILRIKSKLKEYRRVLRITKKPGMEEFKSTVKVTGLGIVIIGMIGFIISMIAQLIK